MLKELVGRCRATAPPSCNGCTNREVGRNKVNVSLGAVYSKQVGTTLQVLQNDWDALTKSFSLETLQAFCKPTNAFILQ